MISRSLALGVVVAGCVTAAAGGSYLAGRQDTPTQASEVTESTASIPAAPAVQETEAVIATPAATEKDVQVATAPVLPKRVTAPRNTGVRVTKPSQPTAPRSVSTHAPEPTVAAESPTHSSAAASAPVAAEPALPPPAPVLPAETPARAPEPVYDEIVLPAASVIGLELQTALTSESARVEDRVDARVTRDVYAGGRLAIPAGSRVIGAVTVVERGGKVKERARLGVRFHTLVLAGGRQVDLRTEPIYREGESPVNDSSKKIGGAAVGGAVLGAILGGGKGAITGGAVGAAGGTAVVMAGDRKPATLPVGSVVTVKLSAPAALEVER